MFLHGLGDGRTVTHILVMLHELGRLVQVVGYVLLEHALVLGWDFYQGGATFYDITTPPTQ